MNNSDEKIMVSIRNREPLCEPFIKLSQILKAGGIEAGGYLEMCGDRIADAELIDGEDVRMDFINFSDMELTNAGVWMCHRILKCYVSEEHIADVHEALCWEKSQREHINIISRTLREMKLCGLVRTFIKSDARIRRFVLAEMCQRSILIWCFRNMRSVYYDILVRIKYHGLLSEVSRIASDMAVDNGK